MTNSSQDITYMLMAVEAAQKARFRSSPNPWVGSVVVSDNNVVGIGSTQEHGKSHAEKQALEEAGTRAKGGTLYSTLEPCCHQGKTGPCVEEINCYGISKVVIGVQDPDKQVDGKGIENLRKAGIEIKTGICEKEVESQLNSYLHHRRTGRPFIVLTMAATLDGRTAAPDGSSIWITGEEARSDVHKLRAESDVICVGSKTVQLDDPILTVRNWPKNETKPEIINNPRRIVFGKIPENAKIQPAEVWQSSIKELLNKLGQENVLQVLVEGGSELAGNFHRQGFVDRYSIYLAPSFLGGEGGRPLLAGVGASTISELQRGKFLSVTQLGDDIRLDISLKKEVIQ